MSSAKNKEAAKAQDIYHPKKNNTSPDKFYIVYELGRILFWILTKSFSRIRYFGIENIPSDGSFIVASNHQCYLDPILLGLGLKRPLHFMARASAFKIPFVGFWIRKANAFPVEQGKADIRAIRNALKILEKGGGLLVFPEGTRTHDGRIGKIQPGIIRIAQKANTKIIPAVVQGAYEAWPRQKVLPRFGSKISIAFGPPLLPGKTKLEGAAALEKLEKEIYRLYKEHKLG